MLWNWFKVRHRCSWSPTNQSLPILQFTPMLHSTTGANNYFLVTGVTYNKTMQSNWGFSLPVISMSMLVPHYLMVLFQPIISSIWMPLKSRHHLTQKYTTQKRQAARPASFIIFTPFILFTFVCRGCTAADAFCLIAFHQRGKFTTRAHS